MLSNFVFDLKYAWRLMFNSPGYSLLCVVVVALSVGLAMWSYEVFYSVALKPMPFPGSDRWLSVQIASKATDTGAPSVDAYTYQELLKRNRSVDFLGAFASRATVLSEGHASSGLRGGAASPGLIAALHVAPLLGRVFSAQDSEPGAAPAVILSFDTWQNYFAANPDVIGRQTRIDGKAAQIVGVMPKDFYAFKDFEVWLPLQLGNLAQPGDSAETVAPLIILSGNQTAASVAAEMKATVNDINASYPRLFDAGRHVALYPAHRMGSHDIVPFVSMIGFVSLAVLLLGCVNISMVFFARLLERSRELALRTALGSSRWRLLRQCLLESVFVVVLGLVVAMILAGIGIHWGQTIGDLPARILGTGRPADQIAVRSGDFFAAIVAAIVIWLLSTLVPAWRISKQDPAQGLGGSGKGTSGTSNGRSAGILVGFEVIVSCLVLVICANMVLAVKTEAGKPSGLNAAETEHMIVSTYPTVLSGTRYAHPADRLRYWDDLAASIRGESPGTEVAYTTSIPTDPSSTPVAIEHREGTGDHGTLSLPLATVSENYFGMLGIVVRSGRTFDATDNDSSLDVAVIDEATAKRYWPAQDALGKRIQVNPKDGGPQLTIVGVVSHVGTRPYSDDVGLVYRPLRQAVPSEFELIAKLSNPGLDSQASLRAAAFAVDPDLPLHNLQKLSEYLSALNLNYDALGKVFTTIAAITVILAATGLFGLIIRSVARRTQEVGIRRALGSTKRQVTAVFLRQGLLYLSVGLVGGGLGIVVTTLMSSLITNILSHVVVVSLGVFALMALVIFAASYFPTRRAVALDPSDALRYA